MTASLPGARFARNLVERRGLLFQLVRRDFEQRFVGSAIGWLWTLIHPLVLLVSWYFAFKICLQMPVNPVELFAGMLPWLLFSETVQRSSTSLLDNANLITKTVFPAEVVPVSIFLSSLVSHLLALGLCIGAAVLVVGHLSPAIALLAIYIGLLALFSIGVAWIVAGLQVYLRDTSQFLAVALTFWFWLTPIFIPEDKFPEKVRFLLALNPLAFVVRAYRETILRGRLPAGHDLGMVALYSVGAFCVGGLFFRQMKRGFADVL